MAQAVTDPHNQISLRAHPHLYEVNTYAWLESLSARLGRTIKLGDVPDSEWDAFARLGFDIIWLMGVWERSPESRRVALADPANVPAYDRALPGWKPGDVIGSPYAVARYAPDFRIGTWDALAKVRKKLHARGMALFLDFVGNHTALDHPWTREHPDFYVQGTQEQFQEDPSSFYSVQTPKGTFHLALGRDPYFPPWKDVAQLNHYSPAMRAAHLAELRLIANHCDGVRCDMAMLQLNEIFGKIWSRFLTGEAPPEKEFWTEVRAAAPGLTLLAEAYWDTEPRLLNLGFSYAYDKCLYDAVRSANVLWVHEQLAADAAQQSRMARFLENHDEDRCAEAFGPQRLPAAGVLMGTLPGMRFYQQGELDGVKARLPITLRAAAPESPDPAITAFFHRILRISKDDVFHGGQWNLLPVFPEGDGTSGNIVAYEWRSEKTWKVVAVNLAGVVSQGRVPFPGRPLPASEYIFYDELNDVRYLRGGDEIREKGLFVRREAFGAHLFEISLP